MRNYNTDPLEVVLAGCSTKDEPPLPSRDDDSAMPRFCRARPPSGTQRVSTKQNELLLIFPSRRWFSLARFWSTCFLSSRAAFADPTYFTRFSCGASQKRCCVLCGPDPPDLLRIYITSFIVVGFLLSFGILSLLVKKCLPGTKGRDRAKGDALFEICDTNKDVVRAFWRLAS